MITQREVGEIKASLAPWLRGERMGRNDYEGFCTERVYALLAKAPPVARLVEHPAVLAVLDALAVGCGVFVPHKSAAAVGDVE